MRKWCKILAALMLATSAFGAELRMGGGPCDKINTLKNEEAVVTGYGRQPRFGQTHQSRGSFRGFNSHDGQ